MNLVSKVENTNVSQIAFGKQLGLDLEGKSVGVARAEIDDALAIGFYGEADLGRPSAKQCALAEKFGTDISGMSKLVGSAVIDDIMHQLNVDAIERHQLGPGVAVRHPGRPHDHNLVVSSIAADGTVYFKGGNGQRAWARSLERR